MTILARSQIFYVHNEKKKAIHPRITRIRPYKKRLQCRLAKINNPTVRKKRRRNLFQRSYFRRFVLRRRRRRRFFVRPSRKQEESQEITLFKRLNYVFRKAEHKRRKKTLFRKSHYYLVLSKRSFNYGKLHITHRRRNTFATYSQGNTEDPTKHRIRFKASCGLFYKGPKKPTRHARQTVLKTVGSFVAEERTSHLDVFLTSGIGRIYKHLLRAFCVEPVYFRYLFITRRRSHGFTRAKKPRRT